LGKEITMNKRLLMAAGAVCAFCALSVPAQNKQYKGAEMFSYEQVKYGKFEVRMRTAYGSGTLSTFFTYFNDSWKGSPEPWREIDLEVLGKDKNHFQSNIITGNASNRSTSEAHHQFNFNLCDDYHTYCVEWTPDYVAWFLDGKEVRKTSSGQQINDLRDKPQSFRFNLWIANDKNWVGDFNAGILPVYQYLNWFRYYEYTPGSGPGGSNFTLKFQDDFNKFDANRWGKGDYTFAENLTDFSTSNIVVKEGYLILCLTNSSSLGHSGSVPKDAAIGTIQQGVSNSISESKFTWKNPYLSFTNSKSQKVKLQFFTLQGKEAGMIDFGERSEGTHSLDISSIVNNSAHSMLIVKAPGAEGIKPHLLNLR